MNKYIDLIYYINNLDVVPSHLRQYAPFMPKLRQYGRKAYSYFGTGGEGEALIKIVQKQNNYS